ncbi:MAG: PAS domain S-box protein [Reyranella sp.]|uniref:PAS domain S-box protein n=1 Tax=Reyranella sp. TaxID=1929291 RepID=UPI003D0A5C2C
MALVTQGVLKGARDVSLIRQVGELLRSLPEQARLALGVRGVAWAATAALVGLLCGAVSLTAIVLSVENAEIARHRHQSEALASLDQGTRTLMRTIHLVTYGHLQIGEDEARLRGAWAGFEAALRDACPGGSEGPQPDSSPAQSVCAAGWAMQALLAPQIAAFGLASRRVDPSVLAKAVALHGAFNDGRMKVTRETNALIDRMASDYGNALLVLALSTTGFAGAGLVLILLVGHASMRHYRQWQQAATAAGEATEARDLLRETIEAVPAGIVVYDSQERLALFNSAATSIYPGLNWPGAIGRTYEDLCREVAARLEAEGHKPQPVEAWLERLRRGDGERSPQPFAGGWLEYSEQRTPGGRTVGLRLDVTSLVEKELEVERAHARYQSLVDSLSDVVYELDVANGRFTFVSPSVVDLLGVPADKFIGSHFLDHVAAESRDSVTRHTTRSYSPDNHLTLTRFRMSTATGKVLDVEVHARRRLDENGRVISVGVIRNISDRLRLERRLMEEMTERRAALDLLKETMDTVPAGIVVYDQQDRLVMFNEAAKAATPVLRKPGIIGITYEDLAHETARMADAFGAPLQNTPEEWIDRFRSKGAKRMRQSVEGRWFEWSEKLTPMGRTVGLRVDVTDLKNRELELERARGRYEALVDSVADVVYALDSAGRFSFVSASAAELLGAPAVGLLGQRFVDYLVPEQLELAIAAGRACYKSADETVQQVQLDLRRADGTIRHVEARYRKPAGGVSEEVVQVGTLRDISERIDLAERLQKQVAEVERARAEYAALVDSLSDVVVKIDAASGIITFASAAASQLWGYAPSELIGRRVFDFVAAEDLDRVMSEAQSALGDMGKIKQMQCRTRTRSGEERHVEVRFSSMPGPDGKQAVVGVTRDIEQRIQMERRLAEEVARLRAIVESQGTMICMTDAHLNVIMVNREFQRFWGGVTEAEIVGRNLHDTAIGTGLDPEQLGRWSTGDSRKPVRFRRTKVDDEGRERIASVTASPVFDEGGTLRQIVFLSVDDTERFETEQALLDAERLKTVGEMAATLAHEISQPLQVIEIARTAVEDEIEQARETGAAIDAEFVGGKIARIGQQLERAGRIVDELRAFVRGVAEEAATPFDLGVAVRDAVDLTGHAVRRAGAVLTASVEDGLPPVLGHVGRLEQVLVNLINNARDAGAPLIEVRAGVLQREGRALMRITVEDTGPGIAAHLLPRLFTSFITTKPRGKGTGLGLRICRRIVEEMGGTITAANRSQGGACFEILLPARPSLSGSSLR